MTKGEGSTVIIGCNGVNLQSAARTLFRLCSLLFFPVVLVFSLPSGVAEIRKNRPGPFSFLTFFHDLNPPLFSFFSCFDLCPAYCRERENAQRNATVATGKTCDEFRAYSRARFVTDDQPVVVVSHVELNRPPFARS